MSIDYSVIIPAYNEADYLPATLASVQAAMAKMSLDGEIVVADNNSTDDTARIARDHGAEVVFEPVNQIARARNAGANIARGRYLIFIDADTHIAPLHLETAIKNLESGACSGGGAIVGGEAPLGRIAEIVVNIWNHISPRLGIHGGCFIYSRRDDFDAIGGFNEHYYASEEIWFALALKKAGRRHGRKYQIITSEPVRTSGRKLKWFSVWQLMLWLAMLPLFPILLRYKSMAWFWYKRPPGVE